MVMAKSGKVDYNLLKQGILLVFMFCFIVGGKIGQEGGIFNGAKLAC